MTPARNRGSLSRLTPCWHDDSHRAPHGQNKPHHEQRMQACLPTRVHAALRAHASCPRIRRGSRNLPSHPHALDDHTVLVHTLSNTRVTSRACVIPQPSSPGCVGVGSERVIQCEPWLPSVRPVKMPAAWPELTTRSIASGGSAIGGYSSVVAVQWWFFLFMSLEHTESAARTACV